MKGWSGRWLACLLCLSLTACHAAPEETSSSPGSIANSGAPASSSGFSLPPAVEPDGAANPSYLRPRETVACADPRPVTAGG